MNNIINGKINRVIVMRLFPGMDVMTSLAEACEQANLKNGIILSMIGSLRNAQFMNPEPKAGTVMGYGYGDPIKLKGAIELVAGAGTICHADDGEVLLHCHVCLSDKSGKAYGGHFIPGNEVLLTVDVVIGEIEDVDMVRKFDEQTGIVMFAPQPK